MEKVIKDADESVDNSIDTQSAENESIKAQESKIKTLEEELTKQKDLLLRTAAEYENFRKRTDKEKISIYSDATSMVILQIIPIADSLERAVLSQNEASEDYRKGLEMIMNQFQAALKSLNVESFGEKGDTFNPDIHNAVSHIENKELDESTVSEVFQKGYKIGDKIIRHAMVQVANWWVLPNSLKIYYSL